MQGQRVKKILIIIGIISLFTSNLLYADQFPLILKDFNDEERKGTYISIGMGGGVIDTSIKSDIAEKDVTAPSLITSFDIGYGITNELLYSFFVKAIWYNNDESGEPITYINTMAGFSITCYLKNYIYLKGMYGHITDHPVRDSWMSLDGSGYELGLGYHIQKHVSLELDIGYYKYDSVSTNDGSEYNFGDYGVSAATKTISMQIKYSWY